MENQQLEVARFGTGCFWCTEAVFQQLKGVIKVESGYSGGRVHNPSYAQVCTGTTGHAEAIEISFDPSIISYEELLTVFWSSHDPTTLNRQGNDTGTQYRSVIFYFTEAQHLAAETSKKKLAESGAYADAVVTEIVPAGVFYVAEAYHQNYFNLHGHEPYCAMVVRPKVDKFKKAFATSLK